MAVLYWYYYLFICYVGPEFEDRIRGNEADNPKFNFLNPNDPYHAYYEHKLKEFREGDQLEPGIKFYRKKCR